MFDSKSLAELVCALAQLTVGVLETIKSNKNSYTNEADVIANINTFAMTRLVETALVNIHRIELIWKIIVAHFDILSSCKVLAIRQLTIEALQTIVFEIFAFKKHQNQVPAAEEEMSENDSFSSKKSKVSVVSVESEIDEGWNEFVWQYTALIPLAD